MKKIAAVVLAVGVLLGTSGCTTGAQNAETGEGTALYEKHITLQDGRTLTCVNWVSYQRGGLSCDWANAK